MHTSIRLLGVLAGLCLAWNGQAAEDQTPDPLIVVNERGEEFKFTMADLQKLPQSDVVATEHSGEEHEFEGVALSDVLKQAKVALGAELRGPLLANYVLIEAKDKYRVVYALPECDRDFTENEILLAFRRDGEPLPEGQAPFRIINPGEKRHSRWIRQIIRISVLTSPPSGQK